MKSELFMIKQFSFWLTKPKMALCGVSGGILRELDVKGWSWFYKNVL